jgi:nucleoid-associated protein YgaU
VSSSHVAASPSRPDPRTYDVRSGDTLSGIAGRYGVAGGWQALWRLNRAHVPNPNVIQVGQVLTLP